VALVPIFAFQCHRPPSWPNSALYSDLQWALLRALLLRLATVFGFLNTIQSLFSGIAPLKKIRKIIYIEPFLFFSNGAMPTARAALGNKHTFVSKVITAPQVAFSGSRNPMPEY